MASKISQNYNPLNKNLQFYQLLVDQCEMLNMLHALTRRLTQVCSAALLAKPNEEEANWSASSFQK